MDSDRSAYQQIRTQVSNDRTLLQFLKMFKISAEFGEFGKWGRPTARIPKFDSHQSRCLYAINAACISHANSHQSGCLYAINVKVLSSIYCCLRFHIYFQIAYDTKLQTWQNYVL